MLEPTLKHEFNFTLHGHTVNMKIFAYRKLDQYELNSCIADYIRSLRNKKLKKNVSVAWKTLYGYDQ
jgi:hypothetical protein